MTLLQRLQYILKARVNSLFNGRFPKYKTRKTRASETFRESFRTAREEPKAAKPKAVDPKLQECYGMLEIPYGSNLEVTRAAWKRLQKKYHPDFYMSDPKKSAIAQEISQHLNSAFEAIRTALAEKRI